MTTVVKNIQRTEHKVPKYILDIAKKANVEHLLPKKTPVSLSLELHNSTTELANAIRRTINGEIKVLRLDLKLEDIKTDDAFIIHDTLVKNIKHIKIEQIRGRTFKLDVYNNTNQTIDVYSNEIKDVNNTQSSPPFDSTIALIELRPGRSLKINNITIKSGSVLEDNDASFSFDGNCRYSCMELPKVDYVKMLESRFKKSSEKKEEKIKSSMNCNPTTYRLEVFRQRFIEPVEIFKLALKTIDSKLNIIENFINQSIDNKSDNKFYSTKLEISKSNNITIFKLHGETETIGNLLVKYIYLIDPSISQIDCLHKHPTDKFVIIHIEHNDPKNITLLAIGNIKKEISKILKSIS